MVIFFSNYLDTVVGRMKICHFGSVKMLEATKVEKFSSVFRVWTFEIIGHSSLIRMFCVLRVKTNE